MEGRDPERWRLDAVGNPVCYRLRGCEGCLCHEYDHIVPFSKGGRTEIENCQILQTRVNRYKGNEENNVRRLTGYSCARPYTRKCLFSCRSVVIEKELDLIEIALWGAVKRPGLECRVYSIYELFDGYSARAPPKRDRSLPNCP